MSPSAVFGEGIDLCVQFGISSFKQGFLVDPLGNALTPWLILVILFSYVSIAAQLVIVLVESFIVVSGGALCLGFAGNRVTADLADNYILYSFHVGIRVFFLYLLTAVGPTLHQGLARHDEDRQRLLPQPAPVLRGPGRRAHLCVDGLAHPAHGRRPPDPRSALPTPRSPLRLARPDLDAMFSVLKRRSAAVGAPGRAPGGPQNPLLAGRSAFSGAFADLARGKRNWQLFAYALLALELVTLGAYLRLSFTARITPYVVEVDRLGHPLAFGPADRGRPTRPSGPRLDARRDRPRPADGLPRPPRPARPPRTRLRPPRRSALAFLDEYFARPENDPRLLGRSIARHVEITSVLQIPEPPTWKVQWDERDRPLVAGVPHEASGRPTSPSASSRPRRRLDRQTTPWASTSGPDLDPDRPATEKGTPMKQWALAVALAALLLAPLVLAGRPARGPAGPTPRAPRRGRPPPEGSTAVAAPPRRSAVDTADPAGATAGPPRPRPAARRRARSPGRRRRGDACLAAGGRLGILEHTDAVRYPYGHSVPTLQCAPLRVCAIELQPGEVVLDTMTGDSERWIIARAVAGARGDTPLLVVKPTACDLTTNLLLSTDRRIYEIVLDSRSLREADGRREPAPAYTPLLAFYYPDELVRRWTSARRLARTGRRRRCGGPDAARRLRPPRRPQLRLPPLALRPLPLVAPRSSSTTASTPTSACRATAGHEAPVLFLLEDGRATALLNYRRPPYYIADRVLDRAVLVLGSGPRRAPRSRSRTSRPDGRPLTMARRPTLRRPRPCPRRSDCMPRRRPPRGRSLALTVAAIVFAVTARAPRDRRRGRAGAAAPRAVPSRPVRRG